ncbi:hypothetical protein TB1_000775 [Malus domestica]
MLAHIRDLVLESFRKLALLPIEETDRTRVQRPVAASDIVVAEAMLVPPVVYGIHVAGEDEQERQQRNVLDDGGHCSH